VRKLYFIWFCLCGLLAGVGRGETYQLNNGQALTGEIVSYNEGGLIVRQPDEKYSDRVAWSNFSQDDLKKFQENPKIAQYVEPFIELSAEEKAKKTEVTIKEVPRLSRPPAHSFFAAMFGSGVGMFILLLLYAANIYAAREVSVFRAQPPGLVCGLAAIPLLGLFSTVVFLALPTRVKAGDEEEALPAASAAAESQTFAVPTAEGDPEAEPEHAAPGGLKLAHSKSGQSTTKLPTTQVFQRGAFMFNRRFFETKFPGFFGMVRRDAEKDMVLWIQAARGQFTAERISRISANDLHVQVRKGEATEEVMIPFSEIKEIQLKHKNA